MKIDWTERWNRQTEDERIYRAIRTGDWRAALLELFKEVRQVRICKHDNLTDYKPCQQCERELDEMMRAPEIEDE